MALVIYWYDFICFAVVSVSVLASLWVLWRKELANTRKDGNTAYESLLVSRPDTDGYLQAIPMNHVASFQLWTSCWKGVHPGWLMATRLVSLLIMAGFLSWDIMDWGVTILMYYTGWTFALVIVYFAIGTAMSAYGCWVSTMQTLVEDEEIVEYLRRDIEETGITNSITYRRKETCAGAVMLTDLSFWCIIVPLASKEQLRLNVVRILHSSGPYHMLMGCMHTLNVVFFLLDTALNSMSFPWFRLAYFVIWGCIYCVFQWVIHACGFTWWPYPVLQLDLSWAPYWYLALVVLHIPCYGIHALIVKAKNSLFSKCFPEVFVTSY